MNELLYRAINKNDNTTKIVVGYDKPNAE